jgi:hypothetical protein
MGVSMRLPPELRAKLAPLLRLQGSSNDGERANASAAITRLLQRHGADWHDLVELLLAEAPPVAPEPPPAAAGSSWKRSSGPIELPRADLIALLDLVEERSGFLSLKSREFVSSLRERAWRPATHLSERQWEWLQDLLEGTGV